MTRARDLADSADKDISGTLTVDNIVMSNDMTVADDGKVIFGAGSDLEIYHDGNSKIADVGDGKLEIHSNGTGVFIQKGATEYMGKFETDGAVTLYYDNAAKLATTSTGVDVEGNLIAKGYLASEASNSTNKWLAYTYTDNTFRINYNGAGADEITIQTDGHVLINNTAYGANGTLVVQQTADSKGVAIIDSGAANTFFLENDGTINKIRNNSGVPIAFETNSTERMRLENTGNLYFGTNGADPSSSQTGVRISSTDNTNFWMSSTPRTSAYDQLAFFNGNGLVGTITTSGSATAYNTSSDYRLKTDAKPMTGASERVQALNPVNFEWVADGTRVDGFLAHEAQAVVPESVTGTKDAVDADGNPEYQSIDQSKIVPLLTAALQEALTEITALKARVTTLEGA